MPVYSPTIHWVITMACPKDRQKRLEAKKQRRRKRQQGKADRSLLPSRPLVTMTLMPKMSEVLADFAQPLVEALPPQADAVQWKLRLQFAALVWNQIVAKERQIDQAPEDVIPDLARSSGIPERELRAIEQLLIQRKHTLYPHDDRLIADVETQDMAGGGVYVMAASLIPGKPG
jgi:hypothetical protein